MEQKTEGPRLGIEDDGLLVEELKMALERKRKSRAQYLEEERARIRERMRAGWERSLEALRKQVEPLRERRIPHGRRREEI